MSADLVICIALIALSFSVAAILDHRHRRGRAELEATARAFGLMPSPNESNRSLQDRIHTRRMLLSRQVTSEIQAPFRRMYP